MLGMMDSIGTTTRLGSVSFFDANTDLPYQTQHLLFFIIDLDLHLKTKMINGLIKVRRFSMV